MIFSSRIPLWALIDHCRGVRHMLRARFIGALPPLGGLEMRAAVDPAGVQRFFSETARRWVRESLDEGD